MVFVEEPMSWVEKRIGRRMPLAVLTICLVAYLGITGHDVAASALGGAFMIIMKGYYDDISQEKQTLKIIQED